MSRLSGHGRVVLLYYELCEKVWCGLIATEQLKSVLESIDFDNTMTSAESTCATSTITENDQNSVQSNDNVADGI